MFSYSCVLLLMGTVKRAALYEKDRGIQRAEDKCRRIHSWFSWSGVTDGAAYRHATALCEAVFHLKMKILKRL